jgi:calcineurin-like phosphoesterase family protein
MNEEIIRRWNELVKPDELVYHVGDFSFKGATKALEWERRLNGKIVHIVGNHDYNNGVKTLIQVALMQFGNLEVLVQHHPPTTPRAIPDYIDLVLCGHIHKHWKHTFLNGIPIINVGQDVWGFQPVSIDSILKYYNEITHKMCKDICDTCGNILKYDDTGTSFCSFCGYGKIIINEVKP